MASKKNKQDLQPLKGFRDFLPEEALKREYLVKKIKETFETFGFEPVQTPALEYKEVLLGKYGEEADKLVYTFKDKGGREIGLRYDQTVPTSRILALYNQKLPIPFRRYQIQNVWRAEKPQKGRFREFTQCDIDIFGPTSPLSDAELLATGNALFDTLGFKNFKFLLNDRNTLFSIIEKAGIKKGLNFSTIQTVDKLDKKTKEEIEEELSKKGLSVEQINRLFSEINKAEPTKNLKELIVHCKDAGIDPKKVCFQPSLARGLDYYTSTIYEIIIDDYKPGSVAGGGRYDNLIKDLSGIDIPATGYSIGFDRLLEAVEQFKLFPKDTSRTQVLVSVFNKKLTKMSSVVASNLRDNKIRTELFPDDSTPLKKQLKYADKKGILWFVVIGPDEVENNTVILKNLETGHQEDTDLSDLVKKMKFSEGK